MSDLIDRQAAIDAVLDRMDTEKHGRNAKPEEIKWTLERVPSAQPEKVCIANITLSEEQIREAVEKAKEELKNSPILIEPEPQWIPCSERLPEYDGEMYLVTDYCEQINRRRIHVSYCYVNREGFWSDVPLGYKVLAWMPLPEPYKGES